MILFELRNGIFYIIRKVWLTLRKRLPTQTMTFVCKSSSN